MPSPLILFVPQQLNPVEVAALLVIAALPFVGGAVWLGLYIRRRQKRWNALFKESDEQHARALAEGKPDA